MGKATKVNFSDVEGTTKLINDWVESNTNGLIKDLIKSNDIDPFYTALILTNAIYFKGVWETEFNPENTIDSNFEVSSENDVIASMMNIDEGNFNYTETSDLQILELPYNGEDVSMIVVLPKDNNISIAEMEISPESLQDWRNSFERVDVDVSIPKFKLETEYNLNDYLKQMGMNVSFTPNADFSGMNGFKDLYIGKVAHKAFVEVNEEGTEAAGATAVHMVLTMIPNIVTFRADHPFLFLIQHKETENILFMGRIVDPTK